MIKEDLAGMVRECAATPAGSREQVARWERLSPGLEREVERLARFVAKKHAWRPTPQDLEDFTQDVFLKLISSRALERFAGKSNGELVNYLKRVCESVLFDRFRRAQSRKRDGLEVPIGDADLPDPRSILLTPREHLIHREQRRRFRALCVGLASEANRQRDGLILELAILWGYTSREISAVPQVNLTPTGVDAVVHRLRRRARQQGLEVPMRS